MQQKVKKVIEKVKKVTEMGTDKLNQLLDDFESQPKHVIENNPQRVELRELATLARDSLIYQRQTHCTLDQAVEYVVGVNRR